MKIAFIRPSMFAIPTKDAMYPLVFAIAKAMTPKNIELIFYDERVEKLPQNFDAKTYKSAPYLKCFTTKSKNC